jgi:hypothetical protein
MPCDLTSNPILAENTPGALRLQCLLGCKEGLGSSYNVLEISRASGVGARQDETGHTALSTAACLE